MLGATWRHSFFVPHVQRPPGGFAPLGRAPSRTEARKRSSGTARAAALRTVRARRED